MDCNRIIMKIIIPVFSLARHKVKNQKWINVLHAPIGFIIELSKFFIFEKH